MNRKRLRVIAGVDVRGSAFIGATVAMDRLARWAEVEQDGYLWWGEDTLRSTSGRRSLTSGQGFLGNQLLPTRSSSRAPRSSVTPVSGLIRSLVPCSLTPVSGLIRRTDI